MDSNGGGIETGYVSCTSGARAYFARPEGAVVTPCVVLLHERYGLVQHTLDLTERLARDGFTALAPDLFFRHPDPDAVRRGDQRVKLSDAEVVADLGAALDALSGIEGANVDRVAVIGMCQTGRYPIVFTAKRPLSACVVYYGAASPREWEVHERQPEPLDGLIAKLGCPLLGLFGEADHVISVDDVRRFRDALETHRKSYAIHLFPDAPHGWLNDTMGARYRPDAAEAAWRVMLDFLGEVFAADGQDTAVSWRFISETSPDYDHARNKRLG
jgi:carboxymethylenebutenolidase